MTKPEKRPFLVSWQDDDGAYTRRFSTEKRQKEYYTLLRRFQRRDRLRGVRRYTLGEERQLRTQASAIQLAESCFGPLNRTPAIEEGEE